MQLDLGGIAKGFIAEQVVRYLHSRNISSALADAGGDIFCSNPPPGKSGWSVGLNLPQKEVELFRNNIELNNKAVATSGHLYQFIEFQGKKYSHIIDPRTGYGITSGRNVTIIANDGAIADWLATACSILSIGKAKKLAVKFKAELLIATLKGNKLKLHMTKGMRNHWKNGQIN